MKKYFYLTFAIIDAVRIATVRQRSFRVYNILPGPPPKEGTEK